MKVIAVLPAYNAEKTLLKTFKAIPKQYVDEIILVDDASRDQTVATAQKIDNLTVIVHQNNRGYGANQKTCYKAALKRGADIVIMIHADFQYDPGYLPEMIRPIQDNQADFVIGSRFLTQDPRHHGMPWWRFWGNRLLTTVQNRVLGTKLSECHSGLRAYSRQVLDILPFQEFSDDFVFDSQMLAAAARQKFRFAEIPIKASYQPESSSISLSSSIRYGFETLLSLR